MHTLLLLRHGKSDRSVDVTDRKRPLNKRGVRDAPVMANRLKERHYKPDQLVTSNALRATTTAEVFADVLGTELIVDRHLYNAEVLDVVNIICSTKEDVKELMLVGHNPSWEELADYLTGEEITMPTCSIVQISFDCAWDKVKKESGDIVYFDYPKNR